MNVFIFHGTFGYPEENWFPWLAKELRALGIETHVPKFPTPEGQSLRAWLDVYKNYEKYVNEETILVGHSLGPVLIFRILEQRKSPIKAAILVAPAIGAIGVSDFDKLNATFVNKPYDWETIKRNCSYFSIYRGTDDPYIPIEQPQEIAKNLGINLKMIEKGGHLNTKAGFKEFPALLEEIKKLNGIAEFIKSKSKST